MGRRERANGEELDYRVTWSEWRASDLAASSSTGKSSALPAAFTRERRRLLGAATDGVLALHSTRHIWRTIARRAGVPEAAINDLGGWAGQRTSSSIYDHGLLKGQLREAQELIGKGLGAV
jgi:integrase